MLTLKYPLAILFSLIIFVCHAQQKYEWKEGSSGPYKYRYVSNDPMKARFYTLKNGLTVMLSPNNKEPRIQTLIAVRAGSNNDPKDHTGLAHYLEHLLFKGTYRYGSLDSVKEKVYIDEIENLYDKYNQATDSLQRKSLYRQIDSVSGIASKYAIPNEYDKMMASMGAQETNAHTSVEQTVYEEDIPSNAIDKFLAVQSERFKEPVFRLFHTELEAVYEEKNRTLDNDAHKVWTTMLAAMFPTNNYGQQTTIGTIEHLKNPSLKAIRDFYNQYYVPGNMGIIMAGDLNPDEVIGKIDKAFSYMTPKEAEEYHGPQEAAVTLPIIKEVFGPDAENLQIGYRLPGISDYRSVVTLTVISQLLSNGKAGLMDINLNKKQRVLTSAVGVENWKDYSLLVLTGKAKEGQSLDEVKDLLLSQVDMLGKGEFDETLIPAIISNFKLYELQGLEDNGNRATSLMNSFVQHKGNLWDKDVAFVDQMSKITKKDVMEFVNKNLVNDYVAVFKRKGDNVKVQKVEKPPITPITLNRDVQSAFTKYVESIPANDMKPKWIDFDKEIGKSSVGGAQLLYVQNKDNDLFRIYYRIENGTWNNRELSLAASYLQFLGDGKSSAEEISRQFYNLACSFSVSPSTEYTTVSISGLQENFEKAMALFEKLISNCQPNEAALKTLKARISKARADAKLNKTTIGKGLANYAMYGPKNPFNYQLSNDELNRVTDAKLVQLLHDLFKYKHTIIYYGPKPLPSLTASVKKLHAVPATFLTAAEPIKFEKLDNQASRVLFTPYDMVQSEITWIGNSMKYDPAKLPVIELFNSYFGGNMGSIVFQTIRESKALAYSTYAFYSAPDKKEGKFTTIAYVGSQADKMNEAVSAMNELLTDLPKTEEALASAKESIRHDIASERITKEDIIYSYLAAKRLGLNADNRKAVYDNVGALTFDNIKEFHQQNIAGKPYTYCVIASRDKISMEDLKKMGEVKELSLEEIFGY
jgi:predicted Zn-dependent peptidase